MTELPDFEALAAHHGIPIADLVDLVADPVGRYALLYLAAEGSASLDELADVVTGWVYAGSGAVASPADRERVRVRLYHVTLPRLASLDVARFESEAETAAMDDPSEWMDRFLEWVRTAHVEDDGDCEA